MKINRYFVYILSNTWNTTVYVGVTNDLYRRVKEHKSHLIKGFTQKYNVDKLVYYEQTESIFEAIAREKMIKGWRREKKNILIRSKNPEWIDLAEGM